MPKDLLQALQEIEKTRLDFLLEGINTPNYRLATEGKDGAAMESAGYCALLIKYVKDNPDAPDFLKEQVEQLKKTPTPNAATYTIDGVEHKEPTKDMKDIIFNMERDYPQNVKYVLQYSEAFSQVAMACRDKLLELSPYVDLEAMEKILNAAESPESRGGNILTGEELDAFKNYVEKKYQDSKVTGVNNPGDEDLIFVEAGGYNITYNTKFKDNNGQER
jgi:hypothetical protein